MFLIGNGKLVTRNEAVPFLQNGCVCLQENLIHDFGSTAEMQEKYPQAEFLDANGGVIMPGLINTHNHIYSAFARGLSINGNNPQNFMEILKGTWWRLDRQLTLEDVKYSALATYLEGIKCGVTTVFDHHASYNAISGSLFAISAAAKELGARTCLCYEISDRDGETKMREAVLENEAFIQAAARDSSGMQQGMMGMHASFTLCDKTMSFGKAHTPTGTGYHIHVAEGIDDVNDSLKKYNKRLVKRLHDLDILGSKTIAVHCVHVNSHEMDLLKSTDTMVVHNPESNMGNAVGCGPVLELYKRGILIGLGTDGYTNDMIESYKVANLIQKHNAGNPSVAWGEIPAMLFQNNAKIANRYFKTPLGIIQKGAVADVIVTDYNPMTPMTAENINSHILFGMMGRSVVTTVINGKVIMKNRKFMAIDKEKILAKSREQAQNLWKRING